MEIRKINLKNSDLDFLILLWGMDKYAFLNYISAMTTEERGRVIDIIRKLKILMVPLPPYLDNLTHEEEPVAIKAKEATFKGTIGQSAKLGMTMEQEAELSLIVFRWVVQYI